jgi:uncharacterized protein (DUF1330 family)
VSAYVVGHIAIKDPERWAEYRRQVPDTLAPWGAEIVFRAQGAEVLAGRHEQTDIVAIRFPDREAVRNWHASPAYQALVPLREQAADVVLVSYEE